MNCNEHGVGIAKIEGRALLAFTCKDKEKPDLQVIKFTVRGDRVWAYGTDGYKAVEADGTAAPGADEGEWLVRRDCLAQALKALERNQMLRLCFSGASLNHARIEEQGIEVADVGWPEDAAIAQHGLPGVATAPNIKLPHASSESARCVALDEDAHKAIALMIRAAGAIADHYQPKTVDLPVILEAKGVRGDTVWRASARPKPTEESTGVGRRRRGKKQTELDFASNGATNGAAVAKPTQADSGIVDDDYKPGGNGAAPGRSRRKTGKKKSVKKGGRRARA